MSGRLARVKELWCVITDGDRFEVEFFRSDTEAIAFARGVLAAGHKPVELLVARVYWQM